MFLKFFYALYERVLKAKDLVIEKIIDDLVEMSPQERRQIGVSDQEIIEVQQRIKKNLYEPDYNSKNRLDRYFIQKYEYLLKGIFACTS